MDAKGPVTFESKRPIQQPTPPAQSPACPPGRSPGHSPAQLPQCTTDGIQGTPVGEDIEALCHQRIKVDNDNEPAMENAIPPAPITGGFSF